MSTPIYNRDYFIAKFEAIPDDQFTIGAYVHRGARCAAGHCMTLDSPPGELGALCALFPPAFKGDNFDSGVVRINDRQDERYQVLGAKNRILAALRDLPA